MTTLKNVLRLNALSSGVTGLALAVVPGIFANLFDVPSIIPFVGVGIFLVCFAAWVGLTSIPEQLNTTRVRAIIAADIAWVIGSVLLIVTQLFAMSLLGNIITGAVALWVLLMALLQHNGLKSLRAA